MRSIRRSLLVYILLLLAVALGGVGLFVDRFANGIIRDREDAERQRVENLYALRRLDARGEFDKELTVETRTLDRELRQRFGPPQNRGGGKGPQPLPGVPDPPRTPDPSFTASEEEIKPYLTRAALLEIGGGPFAWPTLAAYEVIVPPGRTFNLPPIAPGVQSGVPAVGPPYSPQVTAQRQSPLWLPTEATRAIARFEESLRKSFEDEEHPGYFQFDLYIEFRDTNIPNRTVVVRSSRLAEDLPPIDPETLKASVDTETYVHSDIEKMGLRQVVKISPQYRVWLTMPERAPERGAGRGGPPFRGPDLHIRAVVHHARPYTELDQRLKEVQANGEEELTRVQAETREKLSQLRTGLALIAGGSFLALMLGGWLIVARGLAPIRKLSDAVSRVSEKDFNLPHDGTDLAVELAPIHARLTQTLSLLQRAFSREKQAVADISHELRTPIAALMATIDVALRKQRTPEQYRSCLEECRLISKQLGQLVERIMTLASLDAGNDRTLISRVDATELTSACAAVIRPLAVANGMTLNLDIDEALELDTDASKLREVLMNLLHNAVEYNKPEGAIDLAAHRDNGSVVFEVRDTGIGMPSDVKDKIFERFFRADQSRHATGVHAGLGLAIVKEYVSRLNGSITVETEPGVGSTFRLTLAAPPDGPDAPVVARAGKPVAVGT